MDTGVAFAVWAVFTGMFAVVMVMGMCRASAKKPPKQCVLTAEERAQWDQIERHWQ